MQKIYTGFNQIEDILAERMPKKIFFVCGGTVGHLEIAEQIKKLPFSFVIFNEFISNPLYEDIEKGVKIFNESGCDFFLVVGGGSAIDVAKCIKLYTESKAPILAIPTTAGTGSESTRFAVIYRDDEEQSICDDSILPEYVILDPNTLITLPLYQRKCTMLDALCQAIESWWSVNSTYESKILSKTAILLITQNMKGYLDNADGFNAAMLQASNIVGRAINITQTTAAHAMSYKLTSLYNLPHGHSVALCLPVLWEYMTENIDKCTDPRGSNYLKQTFEQIAAALGCKSINSAIEGFKWLLIDLQISPPEQKEVADIATLAKTINSVRLMNNPIKIDGEAAVSLYKKILDIS